MSEGNTQENQGYLIAEKLRAKKLTLSVAESCTGGLLSHILTNTPGSSEFFKTGFIPYSYHAKEKFLKIDKKLLKKHGAISKECAKAMAINTRFIADSDIAISITGVAGPLKSEGKPIGEVYIGIATVEKTIVKKYNFKGNREEIKHIAASSALKLLLEQLCKL
ncbi:MAG: CinA family protein [Candidatus Saelkia tenebricola]|nr:CinA family protein [Candidatus Saelkia tenebricola]